MNQYRMHADTALANSPRGVSTSQAISDTILVDLDNDGDLDVILARSWLTKETIPGRNVPINNWNGGKPHPLGANAVLINDGRGRFSDEQIDLLGNKTCDTTGIAVGDLNGDGLLDVIVGNRHAENGTELTGTDLRPECQNCGGVPWTEEMLREDADCPSEVWLNNGQGNFTLVDGGDVSSVGRNTTAVAVGDLDNDGDLDIVMGNTLGLGCNGRSGDACTQAVATTYERDLVFQNDGSGRFSEVNSTPISQGLHDTTCVVLLDIDGNGWLDVAIGAFAPTVRCTNPVCTWGNDHSQTLRLFFNEGGWSFTEINHFPRLLATGVVVNQWNTNNAWGGAWPGLNMIRSMAWGDLDNDGDADCLVTRPMQMMPTLLRNDGNRSHVAMTGGNNYPGESWDIAFLQGSEDSSRQVEFADFDGDGDVSTQCSNPPCPIRLQRV